MFSFFGVCLTYFAKNANQFGDQRSVAIIVLRLVEYSDKYRIPVHFEVSHYANAKLIN